MVSFVRIYADASGESHFEYLDIPFEAADFVPPAPPVRMSPSQPAAYSVERVHPGWRGNWHPVPQRVLAVYLSGRGTMIASDGEVRKLVPATVLHAEDTTGKAI